MNAGQYTPNLVASHVNAGTALPRDPDDGAPSRHPQMRTPKLHTELDDRLPATCFGGVSLLLSLWRQLQVSDAIDQRVNVGVPVVLEQEHGISRGPSVLKRAVYREVTR